MDNYIQNIHRKYPGFRRVRDRKIVILKVEVKGRNAENTRLGPL